MMMWRLYRRTSSTVRASAGSTNGGSADTGGSPLGCGRNVPTPGRIPPSRGGRLSRVRPLIGITAYVEQARWGVWDTTAALVPYVYVRQVQDAGGRALVVPPYPDDPDDVLRVLDGLLLAGGADIEPTRYG